MSGASPRFRPRPATTPPSRPGRAGKPTPRRVAWGWRSWTGRTHQDRSGRCRGFLWGPAGKRRWPWPARSGLCVTGRWTPRSAVAEADADVAGPDGADDRVAIALRVHLGPGPAEVRWPMRVVGGDLRQRDGVGVVGRPVHPGVGHLDRGQWPAGRPGHLPARPRRGA